MDLCNMQQYDNNNLQIMIKLEQSKQCTRVKPGIYFLLKSNFLLEAAKLFSQLEQRVVDVIFFLLNLVKWREMNSVRWYNLMLSTQQSNGRIYIIYITYDLMEKI